MIVATPDATHEPQVIAAAQAGKHILCEKPMTTTVAGCQRMAEVIRASGITFAMGYTWRFNAGAQTIKALLEAVATREVNERTYVAPHSIREEVSNKEIRNHFEPRDVRVSLPRRAAEQSKVRSSGDNVPTSASLDVEVD